MEVYVGPPQTDPAVVLRRDQVLAALTAEGVGVTRAEERPASGSLRARWVLSFEGANVSLEFQEAHDGLVFATIEQSMFDASDLPDRICRALESLGWEIDNENVG
jgi:hypothetical protein